jgi:hypothetical protein
VDVHGWGFAKPLGFWRATPKMRSGIPMVLRRAHRLTTGGLNASAASALGMKHAERGYPHFSDRSLVDGRRDKLLNSNPSLRLISRISAAIRRPPLQRPMQTGKPGKPLLQPTRKD